MITKRLRHRQRLVGLLTLVCFAGGCFESKKELHYLGDAELQYYKDTATQLDFPDTQQQLPEQVIASTRPRTIGDREHDEIWELSLSETVLIALENNRILRSDATFLSPGNSLYTNPDRIASVYDSAIQESGVLFGGRGVEAALAAFDARWDTSLLWGRNSQFNNLAAAPGSFSTAETANFNTALTKTYGYGGQFAVGHEVNYLGTNSAGALFPSTYTGSLSATYRQPILAGSGTEYTRIAGPITQSFGGITGVNQGVVIARINNDITLAQFEANVRNLVLDSENVYWDLYLAYVQYDTAVKARNSAQRTWRDLKETVDVFSGGPQTGHSIQPVNFQQQVTSNPIADEAQARDAYYQARVATERALSKIYTTESRLRRLLGLAVNDGRIIRPSNEPMTGELTPDWPVSVADAMTRRVELRQQKWNIKSLELQLIAAKSLTRPRVDLVSRYQVNGFGDQLLDSSTTDPVSGSGLNNFYGTLTRGDQNGWTAGVEMSVPVGFRSAHAQVRNVELRLAKAREVLTVQEMEISHEVANAMQNLALSYQNTKTLYNRRIAAEQLVRVRSEEKKAEATNTDLLIRAISSLAQAEGEYYASLVEYNKSLAQFQFRKGTLLEYNNILLAEDDWDPAAYEDALRRARERSHAIDNPFVTAEPPAFSMGPYNPQEVYFEERQPGAIVPEMEQGLPPAPESTVPPAPPASAEKPYDRTSAFADQNLRTLNLKTPPDPRTLVLPDVKRPVQWSPPTGVAGQAPVPEYRVMQTAAESNPSAPTAPGTVTLLPMTYPAEPIQPAPALRQQPSQSLHQPFPELQQRATPPRAEQPRAKPTRAEEIFAIEAQPVVRENPQPVRQIQQQPASSRFEMFE